MGKVIFTTFSGGFSSKDEGKAIQMKVGWWERPWYLIQRYLLRRKVDPPGLFIITQVKNATWVEIEPAYMCYDCGRTVPWSFGCADDLPHVCDDCYVRAVCPICKAEPGKKCDAGLHS